MLFFWATLVEDFYLALKYYFKSDTGKDRAKTVSELKNKSLYGLVQAPLYWHNNLKGAFEARVFKPIHMDTSMFYWRAMVAIIYVHAVLLFGPDQDKIDEVIKELEDAGILFNV